MSKLDLLWLAEEGNLALVHAGEDKASVCGYELTDELLAFANNVLEYAARKIDERQSRELSKGGHAAYGRAASIVRSLKEPPCEQPSS